MADNIAITPGSGATVATDDVGGIQYQRVKTAWGVDGAAVDTSATNPLPVAAPAATTGTRTSVAAATSSTPVLAANTARLGGIVWNDSTAVLYVGLGATTVSATSYTWQVMPGGYLELPANWTGQVLGIWSAVNGNARVTELTA